MTIHSLKTHLSLRIVIYKPDTTLKVCKIQHLYLVVVSRVDTVSLLSSLKKGMERQKYN